MNNQELAKEILALVGGEKILPMSCIATQDLDFI